MAKTATEFSIGIDLGTTNSSIGYYDSVKNDIEIVKENQPDGLYPSYVSLANYEEDETVLVGKAAKNEIHVDYALYDAKRIIGKDLTEISQFEKKNWPFDVNDDSFTANGSKIRYVYMETINPKTKGLEKFLPEEVSGIVLKYLMLMLEAKVKHVKVKNVVITVPMNFNDKQRKATEFAAKLAGLKVTRLVNEPTAAIVEYQRTHPDELKVGDKILVIDFGGGTLDVNLCVNKEDRIDVISTKGDQNLGGNNFDRVIMEMIKEKLEKERICHPNYFEKNSDIESSPFSDYSDETSSDSEDKEFELDDKGSDSEKLKRNNRLRNEAERIKIEFGKKRNGNYPKNVVIDLDKLLRDYDNEDEKEISISYDDFKSICEKGMKDNKGKRINETRLVERFWKPIGDCLKEGKISKDGVTKVLCVGGSCSMRLIKEIVEGAFKKPGQMADIRFDAMTAVCKGAAYIAHTIEEGVAKEVYADTIPYSIGVEGDQCKFIPIAKAGQHLPIIDELYEFSPASDYTDRIYLKIFTGNDSRTDRLTQGINACFSDYYMERLATVMIRLEPRPRNETKIKIKISISRSGKMTFEVFVNDRKVYDFSENSNITDFDSVEYEKSYHFGEFVPKISFN